MVIVDEKKALARQQLAENQGPSKPEAPRYSQDANAATITDGFIVPPLDVSTDAPPAYGDQHDHVQFSQPGFEAGAAVTNDGRVDININTKNRRLAELLAPTLAKQVSVDSQPPPPPYLPPSLGGQPGQDPPPKLNVVIQIVGSRGDVQPFVALGKVLKETYGHRVRIATHGTFQSFVEENGLEFFAIGGDPAELMAFMVKHPGLMPGLDALKSGEITKRRKGIEEILLGCWRSCIEAGKGLGPPPKPHPKNQELDLSAGMPGSEAGEPFVADAIIANPPSFAHIHAAEKLGIPLHMMFTMPWTPTRAFPHPLANIQSSNLDDIMTNNLSYTLVEMMTWQGLGDIINRFREKALDLSPLSLIWAPGLLNRLKISYTYCWSPALIPKPNDWGNNIDISGFYFLNLASSYTPDPELAEFLEAGPPPVYIGFGSIVVDDPNAMTRMIFDAIHLAGVRALVSKGWGGLGADDVGIPDGVFMLGNVPHDWLFERVSCVVHHGGAGTTAAGIKAGKPTVVVPFFGDQPFWGAMVARANAGPDPVPYKDLTAEKLAESLKFCLQPDTLEKAKELGQQIRNEEGTQVGGSSFHTHLDMASLRCSLAPSRVAVWRVRRSNVRLCALAAAALVEQGQLQYSDLKLYRSREYNTEDQPPDPISAGAASLVMDFSGIGMAIADMPREMFKTGQRSAKKRSTQSSQTGESSKQTEGIGETDSRAASSSDVSMVAAQGLSETPTHMSTRTPTLASAASNSQISVVDSASLDTAPTENPEAQGGGSQSEQGSKSNRNRTASYRGASPAGGVSLDVAVSAGKNINRAVTTGVKTPMNFCLGLAKGFRNIPRLYNDDTVRPVEKVTDFSSGLKVAGKELGYGFYDGVSGLVTQPIRGAEKHGAQGLFKGIGKGIGGLIAKPAAGVWGLPAYMMQGVHAEVNKYFTRSVQNYIVTSRIVQGQRDLKAATDAEKADIIMRWDRVQFDLKNFHMMKRKETASSEKLPATASQTSVAADSSFSSPKTGWLHTRHLSFDERKKLRVQKDALKRGYVDAPVPGSSGSQSHGDAEFEQAIKASVAETSRGDSEEDAKIEAAIRESVQGLREQSALPPPPVAAPPTNDEKSGTGEGNLNDDEWQITDEEYQELIERALRDSLANATDGAIDSQGAPFASVGDGQSTAAPPNFEEVDERELRRAVEESRGVHAPAIDEDLERAIEESQRVHTGSMEDDEEFQKAVAASKESMAKEKDQRTEEEIVLEYVKKQSLAEEEFRLKQQQAGKGKELDQGNHEDDDDQLKRAMEESLKLHKGDDSGPSGSTQDE